LPQTTPNRRRLVLVTGSTRSGTSLAAGILHHLGLHVPLPVLRANESNPKGFFESRWAVRYHRRLMDRCLVAGVDARPEAIDLMAGSPSEEERAELRAWLAGVFDVADRVVVKDPRAAWVPGLWLDVAATVDAQAGILLMLRHPAEVIASRTTYYASRDQRVEAWRYRVRSLCGWINVNTGVEQSTRDRRRIVVRYPDLLDHWRLAIGRVDEAFDLDLALDAQPTGAHPVDEFIDPTLRRHAPSWDGMDLPSSLIEIAEGVWSAMGELATGRPGNAPTDRLDALRASFTTEMRVAEAMAADATAARVHADRRARTTDPAVASGSGRPVAPSVRRGATRRGGRIRRVAVALVPTRLRRLALRARG
jgi:hypothetical protein